MCNFMTGVTPFPIVMYWVKSFVYVFDVLDIYYCTAYHHAPCSIPLVYFINNLSLPPFSPPGFWGASTDHVQVCIFGTVKPYGLADLQQYVAIRI